MKINLIGSGNIAWHLCNAIEFTDHKILNIASRNNKTATSLANTFGMKIVPIDQIDLDAELIIIAVNDDEIENVSKSFTSSANQIVLHTSGTSSISKLNNHANFGVLWFLETMTKEVKVDYLKTPLIYHYSNEDAQKHIEKLAKSISNITHILADSDRKKMHLSAVFSNNFSNHLLTIVNKYCEYNSLNFKLLEQIMQTTVKNAFKNSPKISQTGPAIRNDEKTIETHLIMLENDAALLSFYEMFTSSIQNFK